MSDTLYNYLNNEIKLSQKVDSIDKDFKIFEQTVKLSWIELKHFSELKKKIVFGNFLSDVSSLFTLISLILFFIIWI